MRHESFILTQYDNYVSKARYRHLAENPLKDSQGRPYRGTKVLLADDAILPYAEGVLNGIVHCGDEHYEYYRNGLLHRNPEDGPAVYCTLDLREYEEYWENGVFLKAVVPDYRRYYL